jgi:hypothetical protein
MKIVLIQPIIFVLCCFTAASQNSDPDKEFHFLSVADDQFLGQLTRDVLESSKIYPLQTVTPDMGPNHTGGILVRPGGRDCYPAFWIRDYAMALDCGFIKSEEQIHMLRLTASSQCDQSWITRGGSLIPLGAIPDHIRIDDNKPVYFPGTYSYIDQGIRSFGMVPPYDDQYYFIHMAYYYVKSTGDYGFLLNEINGIRLIDRLEIAFKLPPTHEENQIVFTTDNFRGVDFGFRDAIEITGDLCFTSLLKFKASIELAEIFKKLHKEARSESYRSVAECIKLALPGIFLDQRGMLRASTGRSSQPDVWSTALAVYWHVLEGENSTRACRTLAKAYHDGFLALKGNIRHILTSDDYNDSTAWESSLAPKNTYQNGAYWGTPTGWVVYAIANVELKLAQKLAGEYMDDLRVNDYRKGKDYGAPYECFHTGGYKQNAVYLATVACPFIVFRSMRDDAGFIRAIADQQ